MLSEIIWKDKTGRKHVSLRTKALHIVRHPNIIHGPGFPVAPPYCRNRVLSIESPISLIAYSNKLRDYAVHISNSINLQIFVSQIIDPSMRGPNEGLRPYVLWKLQCVT